MESEQSLRLLLKGIESIPHHALITLDEHGKILSWNKGIENLLGYTQNEIKDHFISEFYEAEKVQANHPQQALAQARKQGLFNEEINLQRKNGTRFLANTRISAVYNELNDLSGYTFIAQDLTPQLEMQRILQSSEEKQRRLIEDTNAIIWHRDSQGAFIEPQPSWEKFTGQIWNEYRGFGWLNAHPPEERETLKLSWQTATHTAHYERASKLWSQQFGNYREVLIRATPIREENNIIGWFGSDADITDLKKTERDLQQVLQKLAFTLNAAKVGTWEWEINKDQVTWDEHTSSLLGMEHYPSSGHYEDFLKPIHPDDKLGVDREFKEKIQGEHTALELEFRVIWPDKSIHYLTARGHITHDNEGKATLVSGVYLDITLRKKLEEEKLNALQSVDFEKSQRLKSAELFQRRLTDYVDTVCHEIRNPLNSLSNGANLLREEILKLQELINECALPEIQKQKIQFSIEQAFDLIEIISTATEHQDVIVNDVLDFSKLESGKVKLIAAQFNPKILIHKLAKMYKPQITQKKLNFKLGLPEEDFTIEGDQGRISSILINLLSNAIKFTSEGEIKLTLSYQLLDEQEVELRFSVIDTGIGMTSEEQGNLFKKFSQASAKISSEYGGSGLGLSITKNLVNLMHGEIGVESQKGKGSTFNFTLRCKNFRLEKKHTGKEEMLPVSHSVRQSAKSVLIVEDNPLNQKILKKNLENLGHLVDIADNGAIALAKRKEKDFDIIFMDIEMPVMNGLCATREIRAWETMNNKPSVFIVGLSADVRTEQIQIAFSMGMDDYITKPYHIERIKEVLSSEKIAEAPKKRLKAIITHPPLSSVIGTTLIGNFNKITSHKQSEVAPLHTFQLSDPRYASSHSVYVAGSFNNWLNAIDGKINPNDNATEEWKMIKSSTGEWVLSKYLPFGRHEYKFIVDNEEWLPPAQGDNLVLEINADEALNEQSMMQL